MLNKLLVVSWGLLTAYCAYNFATSLSEYYGVRSCEENCSLIREDAKEIEEDDVMPGLEEEEEEEERLSLE